MKQRLLFALCFPLYAFAQKNNNSPSSYEIHDIKITGYLQTQYQKAQSPGISSFSGGDFDTNSDNRFMIRRGRLKIDRVDKFSSIVFQIDATQTGVQLMDAFIQLREPTFKTLKLTAGLFNRPFGYSIVYSSGYRDFPERARVFQTLMPRERDLGAMIGFYPQKRNTTLAFELAVVNGSGKNATDFDGRKDLIANLSLNIDSLANKKIQIGLGVSGYFGAVRNNTKTSYIDTKNGFELRNYDDVGSYLDRNYFGANLQLGYDSNLGKTTLKGEYVAGLQPGIAGDGKKGPSASMSFGTQPTTNLYQRNFNGYYIWFTHTIAKSNLTALIAYDVYDPNTKVSNQQIGIASNFTNAGDVKYNTLGYGLAYQINSRLKVTLYNEHIKNEITSLSDFSDDVRDDVLTTRLQYRW